MKGVLSAVLDVPKFIKEMVLGHPEHNTAIVIACGYHLRSNKEHKIKKILQKVW